ncbi:hypothetical protein [Streptomyces sp. NPDC048436]|uniref:hypothetical protein n=1 Tax=Streptomyces sp. NPDC048436 TaxID=3365550 RepID=UPI00371DC544
MVHNDPTPDPLQTQRDWDRTYNALAQAPGVGNTALRRRLISLSRRLVDEVPRTELADLRRRAKGEAA